MKWTSGGGGLAHLRIIPSEVVRSVFLKKEFSDETQLYERLAHGNLKPHPKTVFKITIHYLAFACLAGTRSASSLPLHLTRKCSSPEESVAPMMRSGWRPRSKPRVRLSSSGWRPDEDVEDVFLEPPGPGDPERRRKLFSQIVRTELRRDFYGKFST